MESVERRVRYGPRPRPALDNRVTITGTLTGCPACDSRLLGDGPRDRLERLMRQGGRRAHRLHVAVTRLDQRYRDAIIEVEAPASLPWWDRRIPWVSKLGIPLT
ncbi:hypothetical protein [Rhodococcus jostii]|uniref:hypothetical protein n=1 Tax=Rhodococcus jostii TaxID=132919 RepID=UPI000943F23C|nr:hypothetical protein [Rhodococcus jostii]